MAISGVQVFKFIPRKTNTDFNKYINIYIPRRNYFLTENQ